MLSLKSSLSLQVAKEIATIDINSNFNNLEISLIFMLMFFWSHKIIANLDSILDSPFAYKGKTFVIRLNITPDCQLIAFTDSFFLFVIYLNCICEGHFSVVFYYTYCKILSNKN